MALIEFPSSNLIGIYLCIINVGALDFFFFVLMPSLSTYAELVTQFLYWLAFLLSLMVVVVRFERSLYVVIQSPAVIAILLLPILYLPFSDDLTYAFVRTFRLFTTVSCALAVVLLMSTRTFFSVLQLVTVGLTILYGYALYTNAGFEKIDASIFENILNYKNQIGIVTALAGLCCAWMISENRRILFSIVGLALSLFVSFVLSQSATSIVIVVVGLFSFFIALSTQWMRKSAVLKYYMFLSLAFCAFFAYWIFDFDQIFQSLDRDSTLTGRTDIWRQGYLLIADRPIFGYGYEILEGETLVSVVSGTFVPHLHNSWLNITLQFGVAGVLLHLVAYISIAKRGLAVLKSFEFKLGALVVAMLCMLLVHSTVESSFMMSRGVLSFLTFVLLLTPLNSRNSLR